MSNFISSSLNWTAIVQIITPPSRKNTMAKIVCLLMYQIIVVKNYAINQDYT